MNKVINHIPTELNKDNIDKAITDYLMLLADIPLKMESNNILEMLTNLKRKKLKFGPYPDVTLFESANRIMSDLTILYGIEKLLNGAIDGINYDEYKVEYGHDNKNSNDIIANDGETKLIGEGFNVAKSFFQPKKTKTLSKMRKQISGHDKLLLIYNSDAVVETYVPETRKNEYHLKVELGI